MHICSKHSEDTVKISDTYDKVILAGNIDSTDRKKGDSVPMTAGTIFKVGNDYYIANGTYTNLTVNKDSYADWMSNMANSQNVTKVDLSSTAYTESDLTGDSYFKKGSLYNYNGKLYVQYKDFYGSTVTGSKDPAKHTDKWTLLGTIS